MMTNDISLFALNASHDFAEKVSEYLRIPLSSHEERDFEDGEHKSRSLVNVRGKDVFVIQSLYGDDQQSVNDKLCKLLFFLAALRDASAGKITAIVPYLCYTRKDRKTQTRDPVTTRYVANLFKAMEVDRIVALDVHNLAAYQNAFQCRTEHLEAKKLFVDYFAEKLHNENIVVISPDMGGIKRAEQFRHALSRRLDKEITSAFMEKHRAKGVVWGEAIVGEIGNRTAIIIDDLISTGNTIARTVNACHQAGAVKILAVATHGVFVGEANRLLADERLERIIVTDSIPPFRLDGTVKRKLEVLDGAKLFAEAISQIHTNGSIVELQDL